MSVGSFVVGGDVGFDDGCIVGCVEGESVVGLFVG